PELKMCNNLPAWCRPFGGGDGRDDDSDAGRIFVRAEYLLWWAKGDVTPPLVTTGPASLTPPVGGSLGNPGTVVLFGGDLDAAVRPGARSRAGAWPDCDPPCGVAAGFFSLACRDSRFATQFGEFPVLARPIFGINDAAAIGLPGFTAELVAFPGISTGAVEVLTRSCLWGADFNVRRALCGGCNWCGELFAGFRMLDLDERLEVTEQLLIGPLGNLLAVPLPEGTRIAVNDRFATQNTFYGGQLGGEFEYHFGR